jgi:hypothetical protein
MAVLGDSKAISKDVLRVEHRFSEPLDLPLDPATLDKIDFIPGQVATLGANGYIIPSTAADLENDLTKLVGLFVSSRYPNDCAKNNYVDASGNASVFSNGIVVLDESIEDATVAVNAPLYATDDGQLTTVAPTTPSKAYVGFALSARAAAGEPVRVKLEL